ncbi:MupG family TIM beta-alpha barrel fold protein [uncultured Megasphaera sp.]|uniref:MupG family TIM beta-alpha barrel fold protein n=1 Tax=uncultured Megasphaera sp. TaxID=165188 RepID=UPI00265B4845|nr:MupG family TIM beta-alpha barrel fold protein [uncultured Megasphaera sp.]
MKTGISLYPGLNRSIDEDLILLKQAASRGITRLFTSLQIPETNRTVFQKDLSRLLQQARRFGMDVCADLSPQTSALLGIEGTPQALQELGITTVRLDSGFSTRQAALFSRILTIQLNASTIRPAFAEDLRRAGANMSHVDCLHNFYPRPHTGLSEEYVVAQTKWLHQEGLSVGAFIPSQAGRRGPLFAGLPTLEQHRYIDVSLSARHLAALGMDSVFIGDNAPSETELDALAQVGREEKGVVVVKARLLSRDPWMRDFLSRTLTARLDGARDAIRAQEGRPCLHGHHILPNGPQRPLRSGDITVDNEGYLRYMGEIQILTAPLPAERRTNIAAEVLPDERFLLSYITPGQKFRLEFVR